jgi:cardiolipin-specific phospholipase
VQALCQRPEEVTIYMVDLLGFGLSSRARFPSATEREDLALLAERYFVDAMENWRHALGLEKFTLVCACVCGCVCMCMCV